MMLEDLGYRADVAKNGLEAVEAVYRLPYAAVLMDVQMPDMDGYEATREIRKREAGERRIPIIAMTAGAILGDRERAIEAGMDDYIAKPVRSHELEEVLGRWVPSDSSGASSTSASVMRNNAALEDIIDRNTIDNLRNLQREGKSDVLIEFVEVFFSDAPHQIEAVRGAVARNDAKTVELEAHALKANCMCLGVQSMSRVCSELGELGRSGLLEGAPALLAQLETEYKRARTALLAELLPRGD
jgi:CheY-like chemotaxis protein